MQTTIIFLMTSLMSFIINEPNCKGLRVANEPVAFITDQGPVKIRVEIAKTPEEHQKGLTRKTSLSQNYGVIYDFGAPGPVTMWMKGIHNSLDLIFLDTQGRVIKIFFNAIPNSAQKFGPVSNTRAVLELPAGTCKKLQIKPGARALHSLFTFSSRLPQNHRLKVRRQKQPDRQNLGSH